MTLVSLPRVLATFAALAFVSLSASHCPAADIELPLDRTAYFVGEKIPVALAGEGDRRLEAVNADGAALLYQGPASTLLIDAAQLAPGEYHLRLNGRDPGRRIFIVSTLRKSVASLQDEASPATPKIPAPKDPKQKRTREEIEALAAPQWDEIARTFRESGLTAAFPTAQADVGQIEWLDVAARTGTLVLPNPDTRPTSFFPVGNDPSEVDHMSQRLILAAQANARHPNFGGFLLGWDTTGYGIGNRRGLLTYWGWGKHTAALRTYLSKIDESTQKEFRRRTGLEAVTEAEYISYLLSIQRPEFATMIDLPTRNWLAEIAQHTQPMKEAERLAFEKRLDAWSSYLMGLYAEGYGAMTKNLREVEPALRNTASVQVDHAPVRFGQYFPTAYQPLDFQYQSTWNDQVGGPDYVYQWLFTAGLLDMGRGGKPTWLSNTFGLAHARANWPGKFTRVAAHGLAYGVTGAGFAFEGFSTILGSMNKHSTWPEIRGKDGEADVAGGREFLERFGCLAVEGRSAHGVGVLFSKSQFQRQHVAMGFGGAHYQALVSLARLGYTPRLVTEEELASGASPKVAALLVIGQTFPLPVAVTGAIDKFAVAGGQVFVDDGSTVAIPQAAKLGFAFPFTRLGKPHNWGAPNTPAGDNDALMFARWHSELAPILSKALGPVGRGVFTSAQGPQAQVSLLEIDGGRDARYVVAVNDSHIQTQADWHQLQEQLIPTKPESQAFVYDCTAEKSLGKLAAIDCELSATTARVYAVLARQAAAAKVAATQQVSAGGTLLASVELVDAAGVRLEAVAPFALTLLRPDGQPYVDLYRSTDREGRFGIALDLAANVPTGAWKLRVRSQFDGQTTELPIEVKKPTNPVALAAPIAGPVIARQTQATEAALAKGARFVLPLLADAKKDAATAEAQGRVAEKVKQTLAARGVEVEIQREPALGKYWLAYDPAPEQVAENARVDRGELIGRIQRETVNHNDWFSALSGWRFGRPVILLDLASVAGDCPPAETLDQQGILWPRVSEAFPGAGRGIVETIPWAFSPRMPAIVLRATDEAGLLAAAESLAKLPADELTPRIAAVTNRLWQQHHIGSRPASPAEGQLTSQGQQVSSQPKPFAITFHGAKPPKGDEVRRPQRAEPAAIPVPATIEPKQFVIFVRDGEGFAESATAGMLVSDLRFSDAIQLALQVPEAGRYRISLNGVFRYNDRKPCWQAQWEDIIELREKLVPKKRVPPECVVQLGGKSLGVLRPTKTAEQEVPLELASSSAGLKPKTAVEEVTTQLSAELELPAGRQQVLLIHRHIVDGKLDRVEVTKP